MEYCIIFQWVLGVLGTVFGLFLLLSTLLMRNNVGNHYILVGLNLSNLCVTSWYVSNMPPTAAIVIIMIMLNALIGVYVTIFYALYMVFLRPRKEMDVMPLASCFVTSIMFFLYIWVSVHYNMNQLVRAIVATVFSILVYASYLAIMVQNLMVNTENNDVMTTILFPLLFLYGTSWFAFGLLYNNPFIAISNGFGCGVGAVLLILQILVYRKNNISVAYASPKLEIKERESLQSQV